MLIRLSDGADFMCQHLFFFGHSDFPFPELTISHRAKICHTKTSHILHRKSADMGGSSFISYASSFSGVSFRIFMNSSPVMVSFS